MKALRDILYKASIEETIGDMALDISSVEFDSRKVKPGCLFVAVRGTQTDGHQYISQAIEKGATAVACEELPQSTNDQITWIRVKNSAHALGIIAANFYDNPSQSLKVVGVTGTNGKTSIATMLHALFTALGYRCGLLSTIKILIDDKEISASHTTPDAVQIQALFSEMVNAGITHCFMEVSSHAIDQHRVAGVVFAAAIFTNLSHDHLDYHKSFDAYLAAKKKLFDHLPSEAYALVNTDDRNGKIMVQNCKARISTYGLKNMADFKCRILENRFEGLQLNIDGLETWFRLVGAFNAYNLLAVYGCALLLGESKEQVLVNLSGISPVEGRFEHFTSPDGITGIVDYAHTPDALENVLKTITAVRTGNEQVITVAGAGGNRDKSKRPLMAKIACLLSNRVILTSDNPRSEEPEAILDDMKAGIPADKKRITLSIVNRKEAIKTACALAAPGDIILVAGKGHEKYQEIKGVKYDFDDKEILKEALMTQRINENDN
jgi:UDP-N-acetylmuramoyl-L-alanyl-D-glutamate--2,6-diaminopimelate ligase